MSYCKIQLFGKEMGCKFNIYAIEKIGEKMQTGSTAALGYAMIWAGLHGNAFVKGEEFTYTFEEVCDAVDASEDITALMDTVAKALNESTAWQNTLKRMDDEKKKAMTS